MAQQARAEAARRRDCRRGVPRVARGSWRVAPERGR